MPQTAQTTPEPKIEAIEVTGTRIREPNVVAAAPVVSVTDEEIKLEGTTNVENLLNNLPQVVASQNNTVSNQSTGTATVALRGLGANRTLVLIDDKRVGPGDPNSFNGVAADLDFIPAALVNSVEVLTGGASTDYGSDALAGVVNFKMKRDFEGIEFDQQAGVFQHDQQNGLAQTALTNAGLAIPGNQLDGVSRETTIIVGANGPDGKSNLTLYLTDNHTDPVIQSSRDFTACILMTNSHTAALPCGGSVNSPQGVFVGNVKANASGVFSPGPNLNAKGVDINGLGAGNTLTTAANGVLGNSLLDTTIFGGQPIYNTNPLNYLQREDQRYSAGGFAHYEVAPWADLYAEFGFLDDRSTEQIAPGGLFEASSSTGTVQLNCSNPFLGGAGSQTALAFGCGDPKLVNAQGQVTIIAPGLRFAGIPRQVDFDHSDYRFVVGSRGALPYGFNYDLSVSYWTDIFSSDTTGFASSPKLQDALLVGGTASKPFCLSGDPGCVPLNVFSRGAAVAAENAVLTDALTTGSTTELVAGGNVSGDLGRFGGRSPFASDPISVVAGYEYRFENLTRTPDETQQENDLIGAGGSVNPINGSYDDNDFYGEVHIPVIQDWPFAKAVDLDLGLRHSGYSVYGTNQTYDTNTWKFQGDWQIVEDVKLRGGYNRAARAPNSFELFEPTTIGLTSGFNDPCSGATPQASLAACERTGVTANQYGNIGVCPTSQCSQLLGGNIAVKPEKADTYTWGFVFTPTELRNFTFSMDYWTISINNAIADNGVPAAVSLTECIIGPSALCSNIHRGPGGIIFGQAGFISATVVNAAHLATDGIDFSSSYKHDLDFLQAGELGSIGFSFTGTYTASASNTPVPGGGSYDCAGLFGVTCGEPLPTWRHQARVTWLSPWDVDLSLQWRHLSGVGYDGNQHNPLLNQGAFNTVTQSISPYDYFDLSGTWDIRKNLQIRAGVNNVFDRDPPIVNATIGGLGLFNGNTYPGVYDSLGREFFLGLTLKF